MPIDLNPAMVVIPVIALTIGWVVNTWLRVRHGYPLENSWGKSVYPKTDDAVQQRLALLASENAQLRAELGSAKDRLANVERIVTDSGYSLTHEIEALRSAPPAPKGAQHRSAPQGAQDRSAPDSAKDRSAVQ